MLAEDSAVHAVVFDPGGLRDSLPAGAVHLAMGTYGVGTIPTLAAAHAAAGATLGAAPGLRPPGPGAARPLGVRAAGPGGGGARPGAPLRGIPPAGFCP